MKFDEFRHIDTWVFDLDNTLYPPEVRLFDQIEQKMQFFIADFLNVSLAKADMLRAKYWISHGTTLAGMMENHVMPPDEFLRNVHEINFSVLPSAQNLAQLILALPGRKIVYTNGTEPYARNVLAARGLEQEFEAAYGIEHASYQPKSRAEAFHEVFVRAKVPPDTATIFEDDLRNLKVPAHLGLKTIFISAELIFPDYVDMAHSNLETFLSQLVTACFSDRFGSLDNRI
tara:strand:+ start:399 stop:1088 length:690 start_codon:yes stop_codon:yes gene_type:complete